MKRVIAILLMGMICICALSGCMDTTPETGESAESKVAEASAVAEAESAEETAAETTEAVQETEPAPETIREVPGITVVSSQVGKPADDQLAYFATKNSKGFFAVDGTLKAQTNLGMGYKPSGALCYDLSLTTDSACDVKAEIRVIKDGVQIASYAEDAVSLPAGETVINTSINTGEDAPCSGEYTVKFYINDCLVAEDTGTV